MLFIVSHGIGYILDGLRLPHSHIDRLFDITDQHVF